MMDYIKAENLKCRRTFAKKLVLIAPFLMLLLAGISGIYYVQNGYNWWYIIILPGYITLITALVNQIEERKKGYRTIFALPLSLKKVWISKVIVLVIYVSSSCILHLSGMILGKLFINPTSFISMAQMVMATLILILVSLWQIPFCLFLSKKFGLMTTVIINLVMGIGLSIFMATENLWWLCPYSWAARLMCPVLGVLPNGTTVVQGDNLLNPSVIPMGIVLSFVLFLLILIITANWFQKQEVK